MSKYSILFIVGILIIGCSHPNKPEEKPEETYPKKSFGIYLLKDSTINLSNFKFENVPLDSFVLQDKPWISEDMIDYYDFSSHCIYLNVEKSQFFPYWDIFITKPYWKGKPLFFVVEKKIVYICYLVETLPYSIFIRDTLPVIRFEDSAFYPKDILHISFFKNIIKNDNINNYVKAVLLGNNKYKAGLIVEISGIKISRINNSEDTQAEYQLTIKNNDKDNLYVLDPDKAGEGYFNYYNTGLVFEDPFLKTRFSARQRKSQIPEPWDSYNINWFTKLNSGQSITRKLVLNGYGMVPIGKYQCYIMYSGPDFFAEKDKRVLSDGRVWVGPTLSNIVTLEIKN